ncbi:hypothetical protein [Eubacterium coprostanoligenes]|nr:hypothetical protein [Eubacterium coprostanoligenes]MCI6254075.1 hypothetical protein [Eubacterium coprostanoligenes]MDY5399800.1 hypothetical protein [Eubacterium coprostanoligenes]
MKQIDKIFAMIALSEILFEKGMINIETLQNIKTNCDSENRTINKNNPI